MNRDNSANEISLRDPAKGIVPETTDIGNCKSVTITCISETSWFDSEQLVSDINNAGGMSTSQYNIAWSPKNHGGYSALIDVEAVEGTHRKFMLDTGWNSAWMDYSFQREGVDDMLRKGEIEFLYISHEHMDHLWGLPVVTKYCPHIKLIIPNNYSPEGKELIRKSGHKGEVVELKPGGINKLFPGCASATFDISIILGVHGEHCLFFNVRDKGLVSVTGCCHMGILNLLKYGQENIAGNLRLYGIYGGLHIAPFEKWDTKSDSVISGLSEMNLQKVAANHCTGLVSIQKMIAAGIPVVRGTAKYGSRSDLYIGNGDTVIF
jgi:7,8-dihydropterin-6-yl-methyl-4-(beta-D-ribofuranosyl)aminobenzene 5'-phosphate synthase